MEKRIKEILYSSRFAKSYQKIPLSIKNKAVKLEKVFKSNCFDKRLKTHKLAGKYKNYYSFSVSYSYRIVFEFYKNGVIFIDIGTHKIYK